MSSKTGGLDYRRQVKGMASYSNLSKGVVHCVFDAPSEQNLASWFQKMKIPYDRIVQVEREGQRPLARALTVRTRSVAHQMLDVARCALVHGGRQRVRDAGRERLNQIAAHEIGRVEAQRIARTFQLPKVATLDDYLLAQELFISLLGPDLLDYRVIKVDDRAYQVHVRRCFAHENAVRAGIAGDLECGVLARVTGWLDALGLTYELSPPLGRCLMAQGRECIYTVTLAKLEGAASDHGIEVRA